MMRLQMPEIIDVKWVQHYNSDEFYVMFAHEHFEQWEQVTEREYMIASYILRTKK